MESRAVPDGDVKRHGGLLDSKRCHRKGSCTTARPSQRRVPIRGRWHSSEWLESHQRHRGSRPRALLLSYTRIVWSEWSESHRRSRGPEPRALTTRLHPEKRRYHRKELNLRHDVRSVASRPRDGGMSLNDWNRTSGLVVPGHALSLLSYIQVRRATGRSRTLIAMVEASLLDPRGGGMVWTTGFAPAFSPPQTARSALEPHPDRSSCRSCRSRWRESNPAFVRA